MLFWIILFAAVVLMSFVFRKNIAFVWFFLFLVAAFRYKVGTDYVGYVSLYNGFIAGELNPHYSFDFGLIGILNIVDFIGGSYQMLFFIYAILTFVFFYKGFKYYAQNDISLDIVFVLMFLAFLFFLVVNLIRFELAGAIFFYSTIYLVEKRFFKYLIWIIVATLFHPTAILLLIFYPIIYIKVNLKTILFFVALSTFIIALHPLRHIVEIIAGHNFPYLFYITSEKYNIPASLFAIVNTYIYMLMAIFTYKYFTKDRVGTTVFLLFLLFIFMRVLSFDMYIFSRISLYFKPFLIIYLGYIATKVEFKEKVVQWSLFLLLLSGSLYGSIYGLASREGLQKVFYTQYAVNIGLFGEPYIIDIFGNSHSLPDSNMEENR